MTANSVLLAVVALGVCGVDGVQALQQSPHGATAKRGVILFAEVPYRAVKISDTDSVPFYAWMWSALQEVAQDKSSDITVLDAPTVVSHVQGRGVEPVVAYTGRKGRDVAHLAFYDDQMPQLSTVAQELGVDFLVKARLVANDTRVRRYREKRAVIFTLQGDFRDVVRTASVEFTVYDVAANQVAFTRVFSSSDSGGKSDSKVASRIAAGLMAALPARGAVASSPAGAGADSSVLDLDRGAVVETIVTSAGQSQKVAVSIYRVIVQRVVRVGDHVRFDLGLWNTTDEAVRAVLRRDAQNEPEAYLLDALQLRTRAVSTSLVNGALQPRPGEKIPFFIVFPLPAANLKRVDFSSVWDLRSPRLALQLTVSLKDVTLP